MPKVARKRYFRILLVFAGLFFAVPRECAAENLITAKSYIVIDRESGEILLAHKAKRRQAPASTTKLMTALLAYELSPLNEYVNVSPEAAQASPVRIGLKSHEDFKMRDLLVAALIRSANDASVAIAIAVAGTEDKFVKLMNDKALSLGAYDTRFINAHGLPGPDQYTTAYDMLLIMNAFRQYPELVRILTTTHAEIVSKQGRKILVQSRNKILKKNSYDFFLGKTGYTKSAGYCLVGLARDQEADISFVLLGSQKIWKDTRTILDESLQLN
ncbi:D-alanyl-D-alanine carboxypeptidase [PVC group bacterium]|nr:D-alanyl-D-alanine carboxypeptidase [PVC group bacterium]